ncbi:aromatic compound dioxygenase [Lepidopterella palustris CBS 459.81]|uniref:Aromatic compound dioxygenase n=1 Tax=Lepidopterella palustris CBS 459.81 TaxID=1314670 RepID=A0A8E2JIS4_9PEZI|nr:aromatic compound dioxygenase [Lepidopterella palustris CBS 459.81]
MASNDISGSVSEKPTHKFDPDFTQNVINAIGPKASPRLRKVMGSLIQHIHDFARENEITVDEWMAGLELLNESGRMSNDRRNEGQLLCDILGLESLVDEITYKLVADAKDGPTSTAILGPFWRKDAPRRKMGETIVFGIESGDRTYMHGQVIDYRTGKPIEGAELDVWHTAPNGLYEQQDPDQPDMNLRGRFTTGKDGRYNFYCLRPTSYPIPFDGPAGKLLQLLDRHPMRPAHIHFIITAPGYKPIVTQLFDRRDKYITNDAVFAVKSSLVMDFLPYKGDPKADFELAYDFKLASFEDASKFSVAGTTEESATSVAGN